MKKGMIGIVGGMGPIAGIDLSRKIVNQTIAGRDQDHISQILYSASERIGDRTEYIQGKIQENPAYAIADIILSLESMGATVVGLPCNSAHATNIFGVIVEKLKERQSEIILLHMIEEVGKFLKTQFPTIKKVGILGTAGTYQTHQYKQIEKFGFEVLNVSETMVEEVHQSIYHPVYGIKSVTDKISEESLVILYFACNFLIEKGAEVIVLGCTEFPLAFPEKNFKNIPLIDTTLVLARALIKVVDPKKLKSWE
ncbi:MAG: amino acid racemase [Bacteroidetes bacterium]|nr:amino acid racemase [Bacteroidota bacterium]